MEGNHCYNAGECNQTGLVKPIYEYGHDVGQSITGGYVYRGTVLSDLLGKYIFADFAQGQIWALSYENKTSPENNLLVNTDLLISSFGIDANKNLYVCSFDGFIYNLVVT